MTLAEGEDRINRIKQLDQRIAIRHHLKPLDQTETVRYIGFRLQRAGAKSPLFTDEALQRIWQDTQGVPRLINTLCDLCLLEGYTTGARTVDASMVTRTSSSLG